ncbi:MAG: IPT/TIG domain-containing protein [Terriglobales bacterium]
MKLTCVLLFTLFALGCGYGSKYNSQTGGMGGGAAAVISALAPASATAGGPGFTMTVNGTSFATNSIVYFGGTAEATTFVTPSQLMAAIPPSAINTSGTKQVYVNSAGNIYGTNSNTINFTVN